MKCWQSYRPGGFLSTLPAAATANPAARSKQTTALPPDQQKTHSCTRGQISVTAYNPPMALDALERASHEKRLAALASVGSAILLVSLKIFIAVRDRKSVV